MVGVSVYAYNGYTNQGIDYESLIEEIEEIKGCAIKSNIWAHLSYHGRLAEPFVGDVMVPYYIDDGYYFLFHYKSPEPWYKDNQTFMYSFKVVEDNDEYILIGDGCAPIRDVNMSYLDRSEEAKQKTGYGPSTNPCDVLFEEGFIREACYWINHESGD